MTSAVRATWSASWYSWRSGAAPLSCRRGAPGWGHGSADGDRTNQRREAGVGRGEGIFHDQTEDHHADEQELKELDQSLQDPNVKLADQAGKRKRSSCGQDGNLSAPASRVQS